MFYQDLLQEVNSIEHGVTLEDLSLGMGQYPLPALHLVGDRHAKVRSCVAGHLEGKCQR